MVPNTPTSLQAEVSAEAHLQKLTSTGRANTEHRKIPDVSREKATPSVPEIGQNLDKETRHRGNNSVNERFKVLRAKKREYKYSEY